MLKDTTILDISRRPYGLHIEEKSREAYSILFV